jgi:iron(III) transport system permease protein
MAQAVAPRELAPQRRWAPPSRAQLGMLLLIAAVGFYVVYPLVLIFVNSFNVARPGQPPVYALDAWVDAWTSRGILASLGNTFAVALWYQVLSFPIGVLLAWVLGRTNVPGARWLEFCFWLSFFLPTLSTTIGWILLLDPRVGVINQFLVGALRLESGPFNIYSFPGIVWTHLVSHAISSKVMLLTPAFRNMDTALDEASQMSGANRWKTLLRVSLPIMTPPLVIVFLLSFVRLFESFEIELLLGVPFGFYVYSTKILDLAKQDPPLLGQATALGSLTLLLLLAAVPVQRWLTTRRDYTTVTGRMRPTVIDLGRWRWPVFALVAGIAAVLVLVPLLSVVAGSFMTRFGFFNLAQPWTLANWQRTLGTPAFGRSLANTFEIATIAAVLGPLIFSVIAYVLVRARHVWGRGLLDLMLWLPSVVPGVLAGLGLLWLFVGTPIFRPIYGTIWVLVVAAVLGGMTLSTQILKAAFLQLSADLEESGRMSGAGWLSVYWRIVLPLIAPTLIVVAAIKFMFAASATSSVVLLATTESRTLSLLILDLVAAGQREAATVVTVVITALTTGMALLARALGLNLGVRSS